jgi:hypothetical protein
MDERWLMNFCYGCGMIECYTATLIDPESESCRIGGDPLDKRCRRHDLLSEDKKVYERAMAYRQDEEDEREERGEEAVA